MERVDIYDQDGNRTGKVIARGEALQEGEYLLTVGIWIVDRDDRIFLTKRSMEKSFAPGKCRFEQRFSTCCRWSH